MPPAIPCSLSPIISPFSRIHPSLLLDWKGTVSFKFFHAQVSLNSTEKLSLPRHARCEHSRLRCNRHSLLFSF